MMSTRTAIEKRDKVQYKRTDRWSATSAVHDASRVCKIEIFVSILGWNEIQQEYGAEIQPFLVNLKY
jgi:hypothetical protein